MGIDSGAGGDFGGKDSPGGRGGGGRSRGSDDRGGTASHAGSTPSLSAAGFVSDSLTNLIASTFREVVNDVKTETAKVWSGVADYAKEVVPEMAVEYAQEALSAVTTPIDAFLPGTPARDLVGKWTGSIVGEVVEGTLQTVSEVSSNLTGTVNTWGSYSINTPRGAEIPSLIGAKTVEKNAQTIANGKVGRKAVSPIGSRAFYGGAYMNGRQTTERVIYR